MWFKYASMWAGPNGEREVFHGGHGATGQRILIKLFTAEEQEKKPEVTQGPDGETVEDKGVSGEEAKNRAMQRFVDEIGEAGGGGGGPKIHKALFDRGWVLINDEGGSVPMIMSKTRDAVVRTEEAIMQYVSKGPVRIAFEGAGAGFELTMDDIEGTGSFDEALSAAQARAGASARGGMDLGPWMAFRAKKVAFYRRQGL